MFPAQLRMPPKIFLKEMIHLGKIIMGGPYTWLPSNMQYNYKSTCFFPAIFYISRACARLFACVRLFAPTLYTFFTAEV